jgi:hypothetical protein
MLLMDRYCPSFARTGCRDVSRVCVFLCDCCIDSVDNEFRVSVALVAFFSICSNCKSILRFEKGCAIAMASTDAALCRVKESSCFFIFYLALFPRMLIEIDEKVRESVGT